MVKLEDTDKIILPYEKSQEGKNNKNLFARILKNSAAKQNAGLTVFKESHTNNSRHSKSVWL
jgi:hypothetical protein